MCRRIAASFSFTAGGEASKDSALHETLVSPAERGGSSAAALSEWRCGVSLMASRRGWMRLNEEAARGGSGSCRGQPDLLS